MLNWAAVRAHRRLAAEMGGVQPGLRISGAAMLVFRCPLYPPTSRRMFRNAIRDRAVVRVSTKRRVRQAIHLALSHSPM